MFINFFLVFVVKGCFSMKVVIFLLLFIIENISSEKTKEIEVTKKKLEKEKAENRKKERKSSTLFEKKK